MLNRTKLFNNEIQLFMMKFERNSVEYGWFEENGSQFETLRSVSLIFKEEQICRD